MTELKNQVESLLFSAGKRLTVEELGRLCKEENLDAVRVALQLLQKELDDKQSSLMLVQEGEGWKLTVREKYISMVKKVVTTPELPKSILETLAVVAYKAPVLQSQVIKIRTNKAYRHLDEIEELGYITREKKGRSKLIKLTPKFFDYFDVPPEKLKEKFKNVAALEQVIEQKEKAAEQTQQAIVSAAQDTTPQVEPFSDTLPKFAPGVEVIGDKVGELEAYGEAPKPKKKHKKKKKEAAAEEAPKTVEEAAEELATKLMAEAGMPEATEEEKEAIEEEGKLTVEKIKAEAAKTRPKKPTYVPKGMFAEGVPEEIKERIEHRVKELVEGTPESEEPTEETVEVPETIPAPSEEAPETEEAAEEEPVKEQPAEEEAPAEEAPEEHAPPEETPEEEEEKPTTPKKPHKRHH